MQGGGEGRPSRLVIRFASLAVVCAVSACVSAAVADRNTASNFLVDFMRNPNRNNGDNQSSDAWAGGYRICFGEDGHSVIIKRAKGAPRYLRNEVG